MSYEILFAKPPGCYECAHKYVCKLSTLDIADDNPPECPHFIYRGDVIEWEDSEHPPRPYNRVLLLIYNKRFTSYYTAYGFLNALNDWIIELPDETERKQDCSVEAWADYSEYEAPLPF